MPEADNELEKRLESLEELTRMSQEMFPEQYVSGADLALEPFVVTPRDAAQVRQQEASRVEADARTVLEEFTIFVDKIDGDTAFLTIKSMTGDDELHGEYSMKLFSQIGVPVAEGRSIICRTVETECGVDCEFSPVDEPEPVETRPCVSCGKQLESACEDWKTMQPYGGGEIRLIFSFGSLKFDKNAGSTVFNGLICDDCGEHLINQGMEELPE